MRITAVFLSRFMFSWCGLSVALLAQPAFPPHLKVEGNPGAGLPLAVGWRPAEVRRARSGVIEAAPFRCSVCEHESGYGAAIELPPDPKKLLGQPSRQVLSWGVKQYGLKPVVISTPHAVLSLDLPRAARKDVSKEERLWLEQHFRRLGSRLTRHQMAHLYGLRYLRMEERFRDLMCLRAGTDDFRGPLPGGHWGSKGRAEVFVFPKREPYMEFGRHFFGAAGESTSWWWQKDSEVIIAALHAEGVKPQEMAARFDHQMAHQLVYQYRGFYSHLPVWFTEGVGHHFERRHGKHQDTCCLLGLPTDEVRSAWSWSAKDWDREVRSMVNRGEQRSLLVLGRQKDLVDLTPRYHAQAWSMVNYMLAMGKGRFRTFLDALKSKRPDESLLELQDRAFQQGYGVNQVIFTKAWEAWVAGTKPPGRRSRRR